MPYDIDALDFRAGDVLKAADMRALREAILRPDAVIRGGPGLDVRQGARGQVQVTAASRRCFEGVANGVISARSGTAWGTGKVTRYSFDGTAEATTGEDYDVFNPSATTMTGTNGIDDGMRCQVIEDEDGWLIATPLECGS